MYQNLEQMAGLLQKDQKVMLGLVMNPTKISPQILVCHEKNITCYPLPTLLLKDDQLGRSLKWLAERGGGYFVCHAEVVIGRNIVPSNTESASLFRYLPLQEMQNKRQNLPNTRKT